MGRLIFHEGEGVAKVTSLREKLLKRPFTINLILQSLGYYVRYLSKTNFDDSIPQVKKRTYYPYVKLFGNNDIEMTVSQTD